MTGSGMSRSQRNFILQQGLDEPPAAECGCRYAALSFQPRVVGLWLVLGIVLQSPLVFGLLAAVLWWSAALPARSPFDAIHNLSLGRRSGAVRLAPAPPPRRFAQALAGAFAASISVSLLRGWTLAAHLLEAFFLAAVLMLSFGRFCFGSFVFHLVRGRRDFALRTLPWSRER